VAMAKGVGFGMWKDVVRPAPGDSLDPLMMLTRVEVLGALRRGEFFVQYQPKVALRSRLPVGCEALTRWRRSDGTVIGPQRFLPVLHALDLMSRFSDWLLETTVATLASWNRQGVALTMAINLSLQAFRDPYLPEKLGALALLDDVDPSHLTLEIASIAEDGDVRALIEPMERLRLGGFGLSLDDFGICDADFDRLACLPVTELKIDRALVSRVHTEELVSTAVAVIVRLAESMGIACVAEGVETAFQAEALRNAGCQIGQGYLFGGAVSAECLIEWVGTIDPSSMSRPMVH